MSRDRPREPLERVTSLKVKLGLLVVVSVLVAAVLARAGASSVPALLSIPVTVLLALGVTQLLAVGMTSPLREMTQAARRMAAGDYDVRVRTASSDEVGELARAFNRMAADLSTVDRQRRDLVASVSHELRTPLTALVAVLENLADGVTPPDPAAIGVALGQAERLATLVADLLDLSRVDAGVVALDRSEVELAELVVVVVAEAEAGAAGRGVRFEIEVPSGLRLYADRARLHQLLTNLLDNAGRHSPPGGAVRVSAEAAGDLVRIDVRDQGPGIEPNDRERVFERFGTLGDPAGGGTGLGLAIARWVADLHGGRIELLDPLPDEPGAHFRVELPRTASAPTSPTAPTASTGPNPHDLPEGVPMSTLQPPATPVATTGPRSLPPRPQPAMDALFGDRWVDREVPSRRGLLLAAVGVGVLAGLVLPFSPVGLGTTVVLLLAGGLVLAVSRQRRSPFTWLCAALCGGFAVLATLRDAEWVVTLGLLASVLLVTTALTSARSLAAMVSGALAWPLAGLRGLPWLGRTLRTFGHGRGSGAVVRTAVLSSLGVLVFGALFASADAVFGTWVRYVVPDLGGSLVLRLFVMVAVSGVVLAAAYLAINPPTVGTPGERRPALHRFEWLAPVLLVDAVFVLFLLAQAAAFFGGDAYVRSATGLTYADYVHQGFAQLTVATLLTLLVVWAAARKASLETVADRWWLRGSLGALNAMTLVVVASALHRMDLYQDAYGFTRLRLLVDLFEGWLGFVVAAVMAAGVGLRGAWLPRTVLVSGAALLLGLGLANPDAWIARHNLERYAATGKVDFAYLRGLSADATPTIARLRPEDAACTLGEEQSRSRRHAGWAGWNLSRSRAADVRAALGTPPAATCDGAGVSPR